MQNSFCLVLAVITPVLPREDGQAELACLVWLKYRPTRCQRAPISAVSRVRSKFSFGFGYGAETDLTYGFGLVSATAKVHWHKFGFGRNISPKL